ncbi:hypothetical protein ACS2QU_10800 [Bacillus cereus group sp. Bce005]|uniref:hypothetical protein n=1 Tax=Bacillus cereus group TaxID=86661 RepID=UPI0010408563|nr:MULTISPECIES: hypothetical protein [Bacillus cereus group]MBJ8063566.1 hypothetical protein [Bacillus cereus group sp. N15]TBX50032.1 hypothetical protein E0M44_06360 [Bacillus toyonensis]HDR7446059.1 hypothetical protein [Bacillus toyonensis]
MLLTKLQNNYNNSSCSREFNVELVNELYSFIKREVIDGYKYLNPYKFAHINQLSIPQTLKFFMYFCEDGPLEIQLFFECSSANCVSERIFLNQDLINEKIIPCDECGKHYDYEVIKHYIKAYFILKNEYKNALIEQTFTDDPNSTYNILNGMPDNLKAHSPSPSNSDGNLSQEENASTTSEGEFSDSVSYIDLIQNNTDSDGSPIVNSIESSRTKLRTKLTRNFWSTEHE